MLRVNALRIGRRGIPIASDVNQFWSGIAPRSRSFAVYSAKNPNHRPSSNTTNSNRSRNTKYTKNNSNANAKANVNGSDASKSHDDRVRFLFGPAKTNANNARNNKQNSRLAKPLPTKHSAKPENLRVISNKFTNLLSFSEPAASAANNSQGSMSAQTKAASGITAAAEQAKLQFKIPSLCLTKKPETAEPKHAASLRPLFDAPNDKKEIETTPGQKDFGMPALSALFAANQEKKAAEPKIELEKSAQKPVEKKWSVPSLSLPKKTDVQQRQPEAGKSKQQSTEQQDAASPVFHVKPKPTFESTRTEQSKRLSKLRAYFAEKIMDDSNNEYFAPIEVKRSPKQNHRSFFYPERELHEHRPRRRRTQRFDRNVVQPNREVEIPHVGISVTELANRMSIKAEMLLGALRDLGESGLGLNSVLSPEVSELVVENAEMIPVLLPPEFLDVEPTVPPEDCSAFAPRPPIVSVMGHVDHGKTTLLDALRKSKVAQSEHGGITQKIGAFSVHLGKEIDEHLRTMTFINTPGHEAFKGMRARGSEVTDIIVLVVAADDGVRPQTVESIQLALKHNVPLVVAITKMDMHAHDADEVMERIGQELMEHGVTVENLGGETPMVFVSGKTGEGLDDLKSTIALHAEVMDLRADTKFGGEAVVLEATVQRGMGVVVDAIVKWGTLKQGAAVVCGLEFGKVKSLVDQNGKRGKSMGPGEPVRVLGLKGTPMPGEVLLTVESEEKARDIAKKRSEVLDWELMMATVKEDQDTPRRARVVQSKQMSIKKRVEEIALKRRLAAERKAQLQDEHAQKEESKAKYVPIIVKADSVGAISAIDDLISCLPSEEAAIKRILGEVGAVTTSDVDMAETFGATIYSFNVNPSAAIQKEARIRNVQLSHHKVVYSMLDDIKELLAEHLPRLDKLEVVGAAEVLQQIPISVSGRRTANIAGCKVSRGSLDMKCKYRLVRDGEIVAENLSMKSMRHFQEKVSELSKGQECGLHLHGDLDFMEGDILEGYIITQVKQRL